MIKSFKFKSDTESLSFKETFRLLLKSSPVSQIQLHIGSIAHWTQPKQFKQLKHLLVALRRRSEPSTLPTHQQLSILEMWVILLEF